MKLGEILERIEVKTELERFATEPSYDFEDVVPEDLDYDLAEEYNQIVAEVSFQLGKQELPQNIQSEICSELLLGTDPEEIVVVFTKTPLGYLR